MRLPIKKILGACLSLPLSSFAFQLPHGVVPVQLGLFASSQGSDQNINIQGLRGDQYTVSNSHSSQFNGLFGIGYYINGLDKERYQLSYGVNGFFLGTKTVMGNIIQEHMFTNLAYSYQVKHLPVYIAAKAIVKNNNEKYNLTFDAGIGPNFMRTSQYQETSLTGYTLPANNFTAKNNVAFSAMAGVGLRFNNIFGKAPLECGYRFLYLGQGQLKENNNLLLNTINTGDIYANALVCSVTV